MISVGADKEKNLLTIRFTGRVNVDEAKRSGEEIAALLPGLAAGFQLLSDLTSLEAMDMACASEIERTMDLCNRKGVKRVVRVIPDPSKDIGLNIMSLFHYSRRVQMVTCETLDEALKILAQ